MHDNADGQAVRQGLSAASALLRNGAVKPALELLARLDDTHPGHIDVMRMRGMVLARSGRPAEAERLLRRVAQRLPDSVDAACDHAQTLLALGRSDEALQPLERVQRAHAGESLASLGPVFAFHLGLALKASGRIAEAAAPLREVLRHKPDQYDALIALGDVHKALGESATAAARYREAIAAQPELGTAWWSLSNLKAGGFTDAEVDELARRAAGVGRDPQSQIWFEFALAAALDARDRTGEAFAHYTAGNRLKRALEPWRREPFGRWLAALRTAMEDTPLPPRPRTLGRPRPVFVVSLPRSGSTLTEQVLAAHSAVTAASELPWLPRIVAERSQARGTGIAGWAASLTADGWQRIGRDYMERCREWTALTPVFTDKLPGNLPFVGLILAMHPDALVVAVRRDPMDVCWSCYRQLFVSGSEFSYDLEDLAAYWKDMDHHVAHWQRRAPDRVRVLDYEALVTEPERETRALLEFLDLPFEAACLRPQDAERAVATASAAQVREPIHRTGIGHWQRYREYLGVLRQAFDR